MKTISIAGSGIAGISCAYFLVTKGIAAAVYEKNPSVGKQYPMSFQAFENFTDPDGIEFIEHLRSYGIKADFYLKPVTELVIRSPDGKEHLLKSKKPVWHLIKRGNQDGSFDVSLMRQCLEKGVSFHFNTLLPPGNADVIAIGPTKVGGLAREWVFETEHEDVNYLVMDNSFAPNGYVFLFVAGGHATMTLATLGRFDLIDAFFKKTKDFFAGRFGIKITNEIERTHFANFFIPQTAMQGKALKVGEAAGFQDYMLGFGMKFAITSSLLAAQAIAHGENYDMLWKKELLPKLELSLCNRFIYESAGDFGFNFFTAASEQHDFREYMGLWHRQSLVKKALLPIAKFAKAGKI